MADTRSPLEVIDDLRRQGFDAYPEIPAPVRLREDPSRQAVPVFSVARTPFLPLAGISHTRTVMCNESGQYVTYQSDEHGFNNPQGLWNRFPMKIALVGDSFTLGFCVDASKNFGAVLRQRYPSTLNLGVGGSGPLWQLATIKEYLGGIKPRVTLWVYYEGNDLQDLEREMRSRHLIRYLSDTFTDGLLQRQPEIDKTLKTYVERMKDLETPLGRFKHNVFLTTLMSVLGGAFGDLIGAYAFELIEPLIHSAGYWESYQKVHFWFEEWGFWAVFIAGFSPIPYKLFTIGAGAIGMAFPPFLLASSIGRGGRFFLVAGLMRWGGARMEQALRPYIDRVGWILVALVIAAYFVLNSVNG